MHPLSSSSPGTTVVETCAIVCVRLLFSCTVKCCTQVHVFALVFPAASGTYSRFTTVCSKAITSSSRKHRRLWSSQPPISVHVKASRREAPLGVTAGQGVPPQTHPLTGSLAWVMALFTSLMARKGKGGYFTWEK